MKESKLEDWEKKLLDARLIQKEKPANHTFLTSGYVACAKNACGLKRWLNGNILQTGLVE